MKTMDIVKKRIIITMISMILLIITLFGITYAYFTSKVRGNNSESISATAGKLALEYGDGNGMITAEKIIPGAIIDEKTFTVENTGTHTIESYEVIVEEVINDLENYKDLTYELTCKSYKTEDYETNGESATETGTCSGNSGIFPQTDDYLVRNSIDKDIIHAYSITLTYNETNNDQSNDMKKTISARINIIDDETNYKSVLVYGNSIQDGTPTPSSPVEIKSVGDKITNMIDYKSLLNTNIPYTKENYGITGIYDNDGTLTLSGTSNCSHDAVDFMLFDSKNMEPGTYTISGVPYDTENGSYRLFGYYYENGAHIAKYINNSTTKDGPLTFTIEENQGISFSVRISREFVDIKNLKVKPILQKGTEIFEPVGDYKISINISSKNLLNFSNNIYELNNNYFVSNQTDYVLTKGEKLTLSFDYEILELVKNTDSPLALGIGYGGTTMYTADIAALVQYPTQDEGTRGKFTYTFTVPDAADGQKLGLRLIRFRVNTNSVKIKISNLQLEQGSESTDYKPYIEPQTYNIVLDEPLRKVGDCDTCADYIDLYNGKVVRNTNSVTFSGTETWRLTKNGNMYMFWNLYENLNLLKGAYSTKMSNRFEHQLKKWTDINEVVLGENDTTDLSILFSLDSITTIDDFKEWLSKNETVVLYKLATTSQPEKLNINIPKIDKNAIITLGTEIEPSKIETEY